MGLLKQLNEELLRSDHRSVQISSIFRGLQIATASCACNSSPGIGRNPIESGLFGGLFLLTGENALEISVPFFPVGRGGTS